MKLFEKIVNCFLETIFEYVSGDGRWGMTHRWISLNKILQMTKKNMAVEVLRDENQPNQIIFFEGFPFVCSTMPVLWWGIDNSYQS